MSPDEKCRRNVITLNSEIQLKKLQHQRTAHGSWNGGGGDNRKRERKKETRKERYTERKERPKRHRRGIGERTKDR